MQNLEKGQVVKYEYVTEDGEEKDGKAVVCKANKGIVVLKGTNRRKIYCFNASGTMYWKTGVGGSKMKHQMGRKATATPTGETANVEYKDMRGGWTTDWGQN